MGTLLALTAQFMLYSSWYWWSNDMRARIFIAVLGVCVVPSAADVAALQPKIDTDGDYGPREAVQTLIDERAPASSVLEVPEPGEAVKGEARKDVNDLMTDAAEDLELAKEEVEMATDEAPVLSDSSTLSGPTAPESAELNHQFNDCQRPPRPGFEVNPSKRLRVVRLRHNKAVAQYNDYVNEANAYMRCLAEEAQRDLDGYYKAVSNALDAEQASMMGELETVRKDLDDER